MLDGKTIAITRSRDDATEFISLAEEIMQLQFHYQLLNLLARVRKLLMNF